MRKILSFSILFACIQVNAQTSLKPAASFSDKLNIVVKDFRTNFHRIQGDALVPDGDVDVFKSNVTIPGSLASVILRFRSSADTTAGWQAIMFQGETFEKALKIYRNTSRLINRSRINLDGDMIGFTGKVIEPEPNITFVSSSFKLDTEDSVYKKFYADIEIVNTGFDSWEVRLNLHNKKEDVDKF